MKDRVVKRTVRTEEFNEWSGEMEIEEETFWIVQEWRWYWPFWTTCGYEVEDKKSLFPDSNWFDYTFDSYEEADKWRINHRKKYKKEVTDVILD